MGEALDMFSLDAKVVLVTGGTRRYGNAFCAGLAEAGATLILTSRALDRAERAAGKFTARGLDVHGRQLQLADDDSIETLVTSVTDEFGTIDVLVNSARHLPSMSGATINREELDRVFDINIVGTALLTRQVVEHMKEAGGGVIINIGSIYGMGGQDPAIYRDPEASISLDYPLQKGGMIAWTKQLATTLADHNIRANCLSLGGLREDTHDQYFIDRYNERTPMGRMARPDDVRGPIVFLASEASQYMTGANLVVDGGWTAW
ncbi:MAG: SDR family NAD(P)-dependent oxidoreductase [Armatimonadota bacterium]